MHALPGLDAPREEVDGRDSVGEAAGQVDDAGEVGRGEIDEGRTLHEDFVHPPLEGQVQELGAGVELGNEIGLVADHKA
eukprot:296037-Hanusia_phi.AAC.2